MRILYPIRRPNTNTNTEIPKNKAIQQMASYQDPGDWLSYNRTWYNTATVTRKWSRSNWRHWGKRYYWIITCQALDLIWFWTVLILLEDFLLLIRLLLLLILLTACCCCRDTLRFRTTTMMFAEVRLESSNLVAFKNTVGRENNEGYWTGEENSIFC